MIKAGQQIKVMIADRCEVIVNRQDGTVETLTNPGGIREMNDLLFARAKSATKAAGRGDLISYKNIKKESIYHATEADAATDSTYHIECMMSAGECN